MSFRKQLERKARGVTPGLKFVAYKGGNKKFSISLGKTYAFYDWASVTKPVFAISAVMKLYERNPQILDQKISNILPWFPKSNVKVKQLLNHTSGYFWWKPYYKSINPKFTPQDRWVQLRKSLRNESVKKNNEPVYSDLNYFILGFVLEELYNKNLYEIWNEIKKDLGFKKTDFHFLNKPHHARHLYAPTEICKWRKKRMQGEVHDENTWSLGGISTHSGLFGPIDELVQYVLLLRKIYRGKRGEFVKPSTVRKFFRISTIGNNRWALGFMMPAKIGSSSGDLFSRKSIGFLGFTGTSFWFDLSNDFFVVLFTNRVYYGRERYGILNLRRFVHDEMFKRFAKN